MWWGLGGGEQPSHCLEQIDAFEDRRIARSEFFPVSHHLRHRQFNTHECSIICRHIYSYCCESISYTFCARLAYYNSIATFCLGQRW